jgi:hypothetical protein
MFSKGLANPGVFPVVRCYDDDQVVPRGIVRVEEIGYEPDEAQAPSQNHEFILLPELLKELLLVDLEEERRV